jgi:deoxyribose-phosphate aldolase
VKLGKFYYKVSDLEALAEEIKPIDDAALEQNARKVIANMGKLNPKTRQKLAELVTAYMPM